MLTANASQYLEKWYAIGDPPEELLSELGELGTNEILDLFKFLQDRSATDKDFRYYRTVPSQIAHGEAQLFTLSDPRFAIRIVLTTADHELVSVLNIRRIGRLLDQIHNIKSKNLGPIKRLRGPIDRRKLSVLADSLLVIPERFRDPARWNMTRLPSKVATHYGHEVANCDADRPLIPFIRPLELISGGACAQSCCWMADHFGYAFEISHPIRSLPEITWLARENGKTSISLSGLNLPEMFRYYNQPDSGFRLYYQFQDASRLARKPIYQLQKCWGPVVMAIQSYLSSGFPVFMLVDANRMMGRGIQQIPIMRNIYAENGFKSDRPNPKPKQEVEDARHMVLLVGCEKTGYKVLFNDPAVGPLLSTDIRNLFEAGCYMIPNDTDNFQFGDCLQPPSFLALTPAEVRLPLLRADFFEGEKCVVIDGLIDISRDYSWDNGIRYSGTLLDQEARSHATYLLTRIGNITSHIPAVQTVKPRCAEILKRLPERLANEGWPAEHWVWLDMRYAIVHVWDAQTDPSRWDRPGAFKIFVVGSAAISQDCKDIYWKNGGAEPPQKMPSHQLATVTPGEFRLNGKPNLITSFAPSGLTGANAAVNSLIHQKIRVPNLDLYLYQRSEAQDLLPGCSLAGTSLLRWTWKHHVMFNASRIRHWLHKRPEIDRNAEKKLHWRKLFRPPIARPDVSICDWLATKYDDAKYIRRATKNICSKLPPDLECSAVTTYFPEITSGNSRRRMKGINALHFVARLVGELNATGGTRIRCIKVVAGSLIDEIQWTVNQLPSQFEITPQKNSFSAACIHKQTGHERLIKSLTLASASLPENVSFAIELEPSALGIVSCMEDLESLQELLKTNDKISFNCNICHYSLAGVKPHSLLSKPHGPISKIISFHCSDSGLGHFHDLEIGRCRQSDEIGGWNQVLESVCQQARHQGRETPLFSVEIERAAGLSMVSKALDSAHRFFFT